MTTTVRQGQRAATRTSPPPPPLARHETITDLLDQAKRAAVPIRRTFVQQGRGRETRPGPLASFVASHDTRGLDAYLLIHALASAGEWDCTYPSGTWVRAFGLTDTAEMPSARGAVSKITRRLADKKLIVRSRSGRTSALTLLREDGSGEPYEHPAKAKEPYLQLPHAYWLDEHYQQLSLPAKAMLIVALSLPDDFYLPAERAKRWYGVSEDSAARGLRELEKKNLLDWRQRWVKNQRSDTGWIEQRHYTLLDPYSTSARRRIDDTLRRILAAETVEDVFLAAAGPTHAADARERTEVRRTRAAEGNDALEPDVTTRLERAQPKTSTTKGAAP